MNLEEVLKDLNSKDRKKADLAFETIYSKYYRLVVFIIKKYLNNEEDIKDLAQIVFMKLYQSLNKIKDYNVLSSYISMIARNETINYVKKNKKYTQLEHENQIFEEHNIIFIPEFNSILKKEEINIITLKIYYEYTFKEIGELLNLPSDTVASKYYKAIKELQKHFGGEYGR